MKNFSFLAVGILFGIVMSKSEAISWFRIHEMFRFESFHMYGIMGTAVVLGAFFMWAIKKWKIKTLEGTIVNYADKEKTTSKYLLGGGIFGLGWALIGACPGPIYVLLGQGFMIFLVVLVSALVGTFTYGAIRHKLPH
ncbi:MAG: transporter [Saprospiraceae bacterium]|nr:MAG: transporter [Saprospiraceae bacterium]